MGGTVLARTLPFRFGGRPDRAVIVRLAYKPIGHASWARNSSYTEVMSTAWSREELERIATADELEIAAKPPDGTMLRWVPIWVVESGDQVYVRTWHRRENGWFGRAVSSGRARIRIADLEVDVVVEDVGAGTPEQRSGVDAAYRTKYGRYGDATVDRMVADDAVAATLRLSPQET